MNKSAPILLLLSGTIVGEALHYPKHHESKHIDTDAPEWQSRARPTADVPTRGGYFHPNYFANGYFARGYWATPGFPFGSAPAG